MAAIAFMSPLYALPVWLFAARIARHMVLMRIAVPLPGLAPPRRPLPFRM
jgi:cytochrome c oxidase assembly factor CtaG